MSNSTPVAPGAEEARPIPTLLQDEDVRRLHEISDALYWSTLSRGEEASAFLTDLATRLQAERAARSPVPEQQPVAWMVRDGSGRTTLLRSTEERARDDAVIWARMYPAAVPYTVHPLYSHPIEPPATAEPDNVAIAATMYSQIWPCMICHKPIAESEIRVMIGDDACGYWKPRGYAHNACAASPTTATTAEEQRNE